MKSYLFTLLLMISMLGYGQKTLRYEGPYKGGDKAPAEATYSYYLNKSNQKVKHGSFRYSVKDVRNQGSLKQRYIVNFQGEYKDGKKVGEWSYRIMSRNYDFDKEQFYYTREINLEANYNNGVANGIWEYNARVTKRQLIDRSRNKWSMDQDVKDVYIKLNFNNGLLIDSLIVKDRFGYDVLVLMDANGMLNGDFLISKQGKEIKKTKYSHGFEMRFLAPTSTFVQTPEQEAFNTFIKTGQPKLQVDTLTMLNSKSIVGKLLMAEIFNSKTFKYRYIDGDEMMVLQENKFQFGPSFKGLYHIALKPLLSKYEATIIRDLYSVKQHLTLQQKKLHKLRAENPTDTRIRKMDMEIAGDISRVKALICLANKLKTEVSTKAAVAKANEGCGRFPESYDIMAREELLKRLQKEARHLKSKYQTVN